MANKQTRFVFVTALCLMLVSGATAAQAGGQGSGKGGGKGTKASAGSSLTLVMVDPADTVVNWGDQVRFDVSTTATAEPNVSLTCSQNGTVVYGAVTGYYASYPWPWTQVMTLRSTDWSGGAASCVAKLYYFSGTNTINLASMSFTAEA